MLIQHGESNNCTADSGSTETDIGGLKNHPYHGSWSDTVYYDAYDPHKNPSITLSLPSNVTKFSKQGDSTSIHCDWNANGDAHQHNILLKRGGSSGTEFYNVNSNAGSGSFNQAYTTPTSRDTLYDVWGKITDNNDGNYNATATYERGVYGLPDLTLSQATYITKKGRYK